MKIKWYGHATFGITTDSGVRIITDPYVSGSFDGKVKYPPITDEFDIALQSHGHDDHAGADKLPGEPMVVEGPGAHDAKGIEFKGVKTYHDPRGGAERGENTVFTFETDGVRVCFCGDLGHALTPEQATEIGNVDVVLVPVGGYFTIDDKEAWSVVDALDASVVVPMHYTTEHVDFHIAPVDAFIEGKDNVERPGATEFEIKGADLGPKRIIVLDYVK
ncbi:MAG: MBL fold metallo-hydrolase [Candidatus Coatesbacteria bacterium]|nr:MAG: MBL fold metallo-hydrolase [Candidatus Coatesbacteria bacterium]